MLEAGQPPLNATSWRPLFRASSKSLAAYVNERPLGASSLSARGHMALDRGRLAFLKLPLGGVLHGIRLDRFAPTGLLGSCRCGGRVLVGRSTIRSTASCRTPS